MGVGAGAAAAWGPGPRGGGAGRGARWWGGPARRALGPERAVRLGCRCPALGLPARPPAHPLSRRPDPVSPGLLTVPQSGGPEGTPGTGLRPGRPGRPQTGGARPRGRLPALRLRRHRAPGTAVRTALPLLLITDALAGSLGNTQKLPQEGNPATRPPGPGPGREGTWGAGGCSLPWRGARGPGGSRERQGADRTPCLISSSVTGTRAASRESWRRQPRAGEPPRPPGRAPPPVSRLRGD